jgi:hypothetical protein
VGPDPSPAPERTFLVPPYCGQSEGHSRGEQGEGDDRGALDENEVARGLARQQPQRRGSLGDDVQAPQQRESPEGRLILDRAARAAWIGYTSG